MKKEESHVAGKRKYEWPAPEAAERSRGCGEVAACAILAAVAMADGTHLRGDDGEAHALPADGELMMQLWIKPSR